MISLIFMQNYFITPQKNPDRQITVTARDGELSEGRNALLPSDCEREFSSRDALKTGKKYPGRKPRDFYFYPLTLPSPGGRGEKKET